jgi:hypothetical protein
LFLAWKTARNPLGEPLVHSAVCVERLRHYGTAVLELMAVVDLFSGFNNLMEGLQVEPDEKPWYG